MKKILIVDDCRHIRFMLMEMLINDYEVDCISDGQGAYHLLSGHDNEYDLVICDIMMPKWSGPEGIELAKAFGFDVPVLFMSGYDKYKKTKEEDFLKKPFTKEELFQAIKNKIKN